MNETDEQLNLWANGTLPEAERLALEQKMAEDPALAREAEFVKALRQNIQSEPVTPPGEFGLARLRKAIHEEQNETQKSAAPALATRKNFWKPAAIAAGLMVVIQAGLLMGPDRGTNTTGNGTAIDVSPASGAVVAAGPRLQIVFDPSATMADIQASLLSVNGSIVAGPGALGIFYLQLPKDAPVETAVERLRTFAFVEEVIAPEGTAPKGTAPKGNAPEKKTPEVKAP